ncbi:nuclease-related domain-containing protein, partial [Myxococcus qinghaiensis]|uniref:nuclease-related domain-containing protein n=1 Tax=Myxococcus qinghaiensis TaxID=2906758 RepID=UPI0020A6FFBC
FSTTSVSSTRASFTTGFIVPAWLALHTKLLGTNCLTHVGREGSLDDTHEVFFNPFLDGDRPDFIVLKKGCGAAIIEVKDWNLVHYRIDRNNKWRYGDAHKMSPQQQAFQYKSNFFQPAPSGARPEKYH